VGQGQRPQPQIRGRVRDGAQHVLDRVDALKIKAIERENDKLSRTENLKVFFFLQCIVLLILKNYLQYYH
jgi:hypothetical protein